MLEEATLAYRSFRRVKDLRVYKGKSTRELNKFMALIYTF